MAITFFQNLAALASAGLGALAAITIGVSHRHLCALISFAAGTLFATTFFHIVPEALSTLSWVVILLALVSGYLLFYFISRSLFHVCPACAASHFDEQTAARLKSIATLLIIAFGVHCTMDGLALAFGGELQKKVDRSIFLAVTVHKFPEGIALCALLMKAHFSRIKALLTTLVLEASTVGGWVLGLFSLRGSQEGNWFYLMLAHIGGGFIYLAFHALLNESKEHSPSYIVFFFFIGVGVIALAGLLPI